MMSNETKQPLAGLSDEHRKLAQAVKDWWRESAKEWWSSAGRTQASCDDEGEPIPQSEGFKTGRRLICERCANNRLTQNVNWDQAIREPETWFGPGVPHHLISLAEQLWAAPKPSAVVEFTMRIGNVFDSGAGLMVAGTPQGILPGAGDEVEVVGPEGTQNARVTAHTTMGARAAFTLEGIEAGSVRVGDVLQFRRKLGESRLSPHVTAEQIWELVGPSSLLLDADEHILKLGEEAVPAVIDIFTNPINRYGDSGVANQAHLAVALVQFAERGNQQASNFLQEVAEGIYPAYGTFGNTALKLAKDFTSRTLLRAEKPQEAVKETKAPRKGQLAPHTLVTKSVTDAIFANLNASEPQIDLTLPCPNCGKEPLPQLMMGHLFAIGCASIECQHCGKDMPLATDIADPPRVFSTTPLRELNLLPEELVDIGRKVAMASLTGGDLSILADTKCAKARPSIRLAKGFYDGSNRPKHILPFHAHFDVLCNLRALEVAVESKKALPREETLACFFRTAIVLGSVYLNPTDRDLLKIPSNLVNEWDGWVLSMAYLRRLLARADEILEPSTKSSFSPEELEETFSSERISVPVGTASKISSVDIRRRLVESLGEFFFARFFAARNLTVTGGFRGGYEAHKILKAIEEAFVSMGFVTSYLGWCTGLASQEDQSLKNAASFWCKTWGRDGKVDVDPRDYRCAPIGKDLSKCFIASAAYGADSAQDVIVLQRLRDEILLFHKLGCLFITVYETISPWPASIVGSHTLAKWFAKTLIVKPAVRLARAWIRWQKESPTPQAKRL